MSAAAATERSAAPYAQIGDGLRHKKESEPNILLLPRARIGQLSHHPSSEPAFPTSGVTHGSGRNVSAVLLPADGSDNVFNRKATLRFGLAGTAEP